MFEVSNDIDLVGFNLILFNYYFYLKIKNAK